MAEALSALALALAIGALVLASFAWLRAGRGAARRLAPADGLPRSASGGAVEAQVRPRAPGASPYATDPTVVLRLDALERRVVEETTPSPGADSAARSTPESQPSEPASRAAREGWRAFP